MTRTAIALIALSLSPAVLAKSKSADVLGHLGQTVKATPILSRPSTKAGVYHRAQPYEYLIIRASRYKGWIAVVMQQGKIGYIKADTVARLPFEVVRSQTQGERGTSGEWRVQELGTSATRAQLAEYAEDFARRHKTPYKWGGNDLYNGIDCSAFVKTMYGKIGINLPRTAAEQARVGQKITRYEDLQPGDRLYFWDRKRGKIGHTGIYLGNGMFVHSSSNNRGLATDRLNEKWQKILVDARR